MCVVVEHFMKKCSTCKRVLTRDSFYPSTQSKDKLSFNCRECESDRKKASRAKNPDLVLKHRQAGKSWYRNNKEHKDAQNKEWRDKNPLKWRENNLKRRFGITLKDFDTISESQNDCCAICHIHKDDYPEYFAVDHDHTTGKVRGLLCGLCNRALGQFQENEDILNSAINYLQKYKNVK